MCISYLSYNSDNHNRKVFKCRIRRRNLSTAITSHFHGQSYDPLKLSMSIVKNYSLICHGQCQRYALQPQHRVAVTEVSDDNCQQTNWCSGKTSGGQPIYQHA
jgi:hypothetical protein